MSLSVLIPVLAKIGAPILANVIGDRLGAGGKVATEAISSLAAELNVEPTVAAIESAYHASPATFQEDALRSQARLGNEQRELSASGKGRIGGVTDSSSAVP